MQVPWQSSSLTGNFYFASEKVTVSVESPKTEPTSSTINEELKKERERLERLRLELERQRIEIEKKKLQEEHNRIEAEKKRLAAIKQQARPQVEDLCKRIVGKWSWFTGSEVTFRQDGTLSSTSGANGTWKCTDPDRMTYILIWDRGWKDTLTLSMDGNRLNGHNHWLLPVSGERK